MKFPAFIVTVMPIILALTGESQGMSVADVVSYMSTNDYRRCFVLTNDLESIALSSTNSHDRATCYVLEASILLDHAINKAEASSFEIATTLCARVETELAGDLAWQRIAALGVYVNAMVQDEHPEHAYIASTNLLQVFHSCGEVVANTNAWNAIFKAGGLNLMPPIDFIRAAAALTLFKINPDASLYSYTNALPAEILEEILQM